jgi:GAF domain-containing protein
MRRPYYRKPKVAATLYRQETNSLPALRESILRAMLLGTIIIGAVVVAFNLVADIQSGDWVVVFLYSLAYLYVFILAIYTKITYKVRALGFLIVLYVLGVTAIFTDGISGNVRIWFISFSILSGILINLRSSIHALIFSFLTYLILGGLMAMGFIALPQADTVPTSSNFMDWLSTGLVYVLVAVMLFFPISVIIRDLNAGLEKEHSLLDDLNKDRDELSKRTSELDRRLVQIRTAAEISRSIIAVLEPAVLLQQVVDLVHDRFDLYYVGVFLVDERDEHAILHAGTGQAGKQMVDEGHKLPIGGSSMVGWTIAHRQARIALDTGDEAVRFNNPLLPKTRSEMAIPLMSGDQVFGAITIQSTKSNAFDQDDITVLQGIADSLATALQNARLFQQEKKNLEEIRELNRQYLVDAWKNITGKEELRSIGYVNEQASDTTGKFAEVTIPIALRDQNLGRVSLEIPSASLSDDDMAFVEQVTNQAALAMENVRLLEEAQRRANRERMVAEIVKKARATTDVDTIFRTTLGELGKAMQATEGVIHLANPERRSETSLDRSEL